jgi:hypothetical protein
MHAFIRVIRAIRGLPRIEKLDLIASSFGICGLAWIGGLPVEAPRLNRSRDKHQRTRDEQRGTPVRSGQAQKTRLTTLASFIPFAEIFSG